MRKLFTLCLLVFSLSASAQWQQTGSKVRYVNGLGIPTRDTAAGVAADSSQILIRPADSALYVKYKRTWLRVGGGTVSGTTNRVSKFTGATTVGNSSIVDSASAVAMTITPAGNIGIGTTSPAHKLDVQSSGLNIVRIKGGTGTGQGSAFYQTFAGSASTMSAFGDRGTMFGTTVDQITSIFTGSNIPLTFDVNASERMRITSAGDVGIGTASPAGRFVVADGQTLLGTNTNNGVDRLQVSGNVEIRGQSGNVTTPTYLKLDQSYSLTPAFNKLKIYFYVDATESYGYGVGSNSDLQYWAGSTTTGMHRFYTKQTEAVRITPNQSILINTTTDNNTDKLQVNGSIQGTGFNQAYLARTTTYTATTSDYFIDCTSGTFTVNLFTAVGNTGRILIIKNSGTGTITVDGNASETIDGATTYSLSAQWATVQIMCDGGNWKIISKF